MATNDVVLKPTMPATETSSSTFNTILTRLVRNELSDTSSRLVAAPSRRLTQLMSL